MSGKKSRNKGVRGEHQWKEMLHILGFDDAYRTGQFCGQKAQDVEANNSLSTVFFEVKWEESLDLGTDKLKGYLEKAELDALSLSPNMTAIVVWKKNHKPWKLTYRSEEGYIVTLSYIEDIKDFLDRHRDRDRTRSS